MSASTMDAPEPGSLVLVGPTGAGKTAFLASLGRSFDLERNVRWARFVAPSHIAALIQDRKPVQERWATYSFQFGIAPASGGSRKPAPTELEVSVLDTPGELFESLAGDGAEGSSPVWVRDLLLAAMKARCLVLCCAVGGRRIDLTRFVSSLLSTASRRLERLAGKPWPRHDTPLERAPRLELPFERVLLLLTGIETLCAETSLQIARQAEHWRRSRPAVIRSLKSYQNLASRDLASLLDLRSLAAQKVYGLDLLASSLKPGAQFAVCATSSSLGRTARPFGVWPALLFSITGEVAAPLVTLAGGATPSSNGFPLQDKGS